MGGQEGAVQEVLGKSIQDLSALFYADDGLVTSPESAQLQVAFNPLTGIFGRVGLRSNKVNTVGMAYRPCHILHAWSTEAYTWRVTVPGLSYRDRI